MAMPSGTISPGDFSAHAVSPELRREIATLTRLVWPSTQTLDQQIENRCREDERDCDAMSQVRWHLVHDEGKLVAMSRTFRRVVATESGQHFPVLALANVCVHPEFRGRSHGRQAVQMAWARLSAELPLSFYQSGVPAFYERLGARLVPNRIYDSTGADCAFWEPHAMIYPANASWPGEAIDLLGRGW